MNRKNEVITGLFVLLGAAVVVLGALWLSESDWRGDYERLEARFQSIGQIRTGNVVTLRGVDVGRVDGVEFAGRGVDVTFRIHEDAPVPDRPVVILRPLSLFGEWGAEIVSETGHPVRADTLALPEGVVPGVTASDFAQIGDYTADIAANLEGITARLELAFNEETAEEVAEAIGNLERASEELASLMSRQRASFGTFATDIEEAGITLRAASADLNATMDRLEEATGEGELEAIFENSRQATVAVRDVGEELRTTTRDMGRTLTRADSALRQAELFLGELNRGEGALGRLASDPLLYEDLGATLAELRLLVNDLRGNPDKYFRLSIF